MADEQQTPPPPLPSLAELDARMKQIKRKSAKLRREAKKVIAHVQGVFDDMKKKKRPLTLAEMFEGNDCRCFLEDRSGEGDDVCRVCWDMKRSEG